MLTDVQKRIKCKIGHKNFKLFQKEVKKVIDESFYSEEAIWDIAEQAINDVSLEKPLNVPEWMRLNEKC